MRIVCPTREGLSRHDYPANDPCIACALLRLGTDWICHEVLDVSLAQQIHHAQRIKHKRKKLVLERRHTAYRTPKPCSCWMCGNPRKWFGERTVQERRAMQEVE